MKNTLEIRKSLIVAMVLTALSGSFFTFLFTDFGMMVNPDGSMGDCPFNQNGSLCTMNFKEHMSLWKAMFTALPQKVIALSFMFLALLFFVPIFVFKNPLLKYSNLLFHSYRLYTKQNSYISLTDPLKQAIYQGIITPKIF